ncbi:MAG: TonB-dependent receptor, partial [Paludibacter sp.]
EFNSLRLKNSHQLDIRIDKEFYFKKWVLNLYADVQNAYIFKSESEPIYTNKDTSGNVMINPTDNSRYILRELNDNVSGTILPTIGIIIKI